MERFTGDNFLNRGLAGDKNREREIAEGKFLEKEGLLEISRRRRISKRNRWRKRIEENL